MFAIEDPLFSIGSSDYAEFISQVCMKHLVQKFDQGVCWFSKWMDFKALTGNH